MLRGKDGGSMRVVDDVCVNGGGGSLSMGREQWELADSTEGSLELSADML